MIDIRIERPFIRRVRLATAAMLPGWTTLRAALDGSELRMLICHCNVITEKEVEQAILDLLEQDPWSLIVPAKVYHSMRKRGRCCGCFPNVVETIIRVTEAYHARLQPIEPHVVSHLDRVRELRSTYGRKLNEGRSPSHRAA